MNEYLLEKLHLRYQWIADEWIFPGVYGLLDPETTNKRNIIYIGRSKNILRRWTDHLMGQGTPEVTRWIESRGVMPNLLVLSLDPEDESDVIDRYARLGDPLLNRGAKTWTPEQVGKVLE